MFFLLKKHTGYVTASKEMYQSMKMHKFHEFDVVLPATAVKSCKIDKIQ